MNGGRSGGVIFNNSCSTHYKEPLPSLVRLFVIGGSGLLALCMHLIFGCLGFWGEENTKKRVKSIQAVYSSSEKDVTRG